MYTSVQYVHLHTGNEPHAICQQCCMRDKLHLDIKLFLTSLTFTVRVFGNWLCIAQRITYCHNLFAVVGSSIISADLAHNRIKYIESNILINMTALTHLYLEDNMISEQTFPILSLTHLTVLKELHLERNVFTRFENISHMQDL